MSSDWWRVRIAQDFGNDIHNIATSLEKISRILEELNNRLKEEKK
jgi:hypothetical protein